MNTHKTNKKQKGFTLVEIIVVVGLLAMLGLIAALMVGAAAESARQAAIRADAQTIARQMNTLNALILNPSSQVTTGAHLHPTSLAGGAYFIPITPLGNYNLPVTLDLNVVLENAERWQAVSPLIINVGSAATPHMGVSPAP